MKKYYFPLITGTLIGFACWLVDSAIAVLTINNISLTGALLTEVSLLRLSCRLLVLLAAVLVGGYKSLSLYQSSHRRLDLDNRQQEAPIAENFRQKAIRRPQEGEIEEVHRSVRKQKSSLTNKNVSANSRLIWQYAGALGERINLSDAELQQLQAVCYFHDVGRFCLPDSKMDLHAEVSARIVEGIEGFQPAAEAIRMHHEKYNGSGPLGVRAQNIPLFARIFSIAWVYHALTKPSGAYHLKTDDALEMLYAYSGTALDPELVSIFIGMTSHGKIFVDNAAVAYNR